MPILNMIYWATWWGGWWQPWANTIAYYPLTSDTTVNDMSGNNRNLTNNWVQFWEYAWANCGYFNWSSYLAINSNPLTWSSDFTAVSWFYNTQNSSGWQNSIAFWAPSWSNAFSTWINNSGRKLMVWGWNNDRDTWYVVPVNTWICCVMSHSWWTIKTYVNWNLVNTSTVSFNLWSSKTRIWCWLSNDLDKFYWYIWECIIEDKAWTEQEASDYYNQTKSNYYWL